MSVVNWGRWGSLIGAGVSCMGDYEVFRILWYHSEAWVYLKLRIFFLFLRCPWVTHVKINKECIELRIAYRIRASICLRIYLCI